MPNLMDGHVFDNFREFAISFDAASQEQAESLELNVYWRYQSADEQQAFA